MGNPNFNKGGKPNNNRDNFFKRELQKYRSSTPIDFMLGKDSFARNRICKSICMDIANGNIDVEKESSYFNNPTLLDQLISFTYSKKFYYGTITEYVTAEHERRKSINPGYAYTYGPSIAEIINTNSRSYFAYNVLYQGFSNMKVDGNTKGWIECMISQLTSGRYASNI